MELANAAPLILLVSWILSASAQRSTYIVHMDKSSMPKAFSSHHYWYSSMLKSANSVTQTSLSTNKPEPKLIYTYDNAFHGFSAVMSKHELEALKKFPGFISAYADGVITADTTRSPEFLSLNPASGIWPASDYGKDVIIGVIDYGIWPEHPSFRDNGFTQVPARWKGICQAGQDFNSSTCNRKIIGARYFNKGFRETGIEITMDSARDVNGHGTHVASIAAGNAVDGVTFFGYATGTARGVAPRARLAVYKVLWSGGVESDILAGMDQAVADGVDVISVSLSSRAIELYANPLAIASFGAREKGIVVCVSAGNRGPSVRTIRSGIPWAVVVSSGTIDRWLAGTLTLGNGKTITGFTAFPGSAIVRNLTLFYNHTLSTCYPADLAEAPFGSIVVCNVTFTQNRDFDGVMESLASSNVRAGIIIVDDPNQYESSAFRFPAVAISPTEALEIVRYVSSTSEPRASINFQQTILGTSPRAAPALSEHSSRGPSRNYERILKPDLMAPGVLILAAYYPYAESSRIGNNIFLSNDYVLLSGTSMACPHVSGTAALLKGAHPEWSPAAIQSAMMTTANPLDNTKQPIKVMYVSSPLGIGSGMVDPNRALNPGLVYDASVQDLVNLVCSMNFTANQTRTLIRSSHNCSINASSDLNYPSFVAIYQSAEVGRSVTRTFRRTVTNVGDGAARYRAEVEIPPNTTVRVRPMTLEFEKKNEKQSYSLTIRYRGDLEIQHRAGSLTWVDQSGKYTVRSPIMVSAGADNFG